MGVRAKPRLTHYGDGCGHHHHDIEQHWASAFNDLSDFVCIGYNLKGKQEGKQT